MAYNDRKRKRKEDEDGERFRDQETQVSFVDEPRFSRMHTDKRFASIPVSQRKVMVDRRFASMMKDGKFGMIVKKDPRGGKDVSRMSDEAEKLRQIYKVEEDLSSAGSDGSDDSDEDRNDQNVSIESNGDSPINEKGVGKDREEQLDDLESFWFDFFQKNDQESLKSSNCEQDSSSAEEFSESSDEDNLELISQPDPIILNDKIQPYLEVGSETNRLAVVNIDWRSMSATDLLIIFKSFLPPTGVIKSIIIYLSDFGKERRKEELENGPPIWKKMNETQVGIGSKSEDGDLTPLDRDKLLAYEREKLSYYFAIIDCDSISTASSLYDALDQSDLENSQLPLDLRFVPDDFDLDGRIIEDKVTNLPTNYVSPHFNPNAMQTTNTRLTWDEDSRDRIQWNKACHSAMVAPWDAEWDQETFTKYIASGSDSSGNENEFSRERYESILKPMMEFKESEVEVEDLVFDGETRPLDDQVQCILDRKVGEEEEGEEEEGEEGILKERERALKVESGGVFDSWMQSYRHRKREILRQSGQVPNSSQLSVQSSVESLERSGSKSGHHIRDMSDSDEDSDEDSDNQEDSQEESKFKSKSKFKSNTKSNSKRLSARQKMRLKRDQLEKDKIKAEKDLNVNDPRFKNLIQDPRFTLDPTHPRFEKSLVAGKILEARKEYQTKNNREDHQPSNNSFINKSTEIRGYFDQEREKIRNPTDLSKLVHAIKDKRSKITANRIR